MDVVIPAVELHVHLEGTLTPALATALAARNGSVEALPAFDWITPGYRWGDPRRWLATMRKVGDACLRTAADYGDVMRDYCSRLHADGVIYAEISVSLSRAVRDARDDQAILQAVCDAAAQAPLPVGVIAALDQQMQQEEAMHAIRSVLPLRERGVVGIDLQGIPSQRSIAFAEAFAFARANGLGTRVHAGEVQGPASVRDALQLGVDRIAHGVRAVEDEALLAELVRAGVVLDVCPGSNLALGLYADAHSHPLRRLFDLDIAVTLSSDDPLYFNTSARAEYEAAAQLGFTQQELLAITRTAIDAGFASASLKQQLRQQLAAA